MKRRRVVYEAGTGGPIQTIEDVTFIREAQDLAGIDVEHGVTIDRVIYTRSTFIPTARLIRIETDPQNMPEA